MTAATTPSTTARTTQRATAHPPVSSARASSCLNAAVTSDPCRRRNSAGKSASNTRDTDAAQRPRRPAFTG